MAISQPVTARPPVLLGVAACAIAAAVATRAVRSPAIDLSVFRAGGAAVLDGLPVYNGPLTAGLDFTYPPLAALLFVPLALIPLTVAQVLVTFINLAVLAFVVWLSHRALRGPGPELIGLTPLAIGLLFWIEPVRTTVYLGQVNLVLMAIVLWDLLRGDHCRGKGIGVGIAAGIKLTPLIFVPYLLITRRFRAASVAAATFLGTILVGVLLLPADAAKYWLTGMFADSRRIYPSVSSPHNQSLHGMLARVGAPETIWFLLAVLTTAGALCLAAWASRRNEELLALTLCGLCAAAVSPHSWGHHWVWLAVLAVFLAHLVITRFRWPWHAPWLLVLGLLPLTLPWVVNLADPPTGAPELTHGPAASLLVNVYMVLFVLTVVAVVGHLRSTRRIEFDISSKQQRVPH